MNDTISLAGASVASLKLLNEDVLVRPRAQEEIRSSGLFIPNAPSQNFLGGAFYGTVVAVGPGRIVERAVLPESVADIARTIIAIHYRHESIGGLSDLVAGAIKDHMAKHAQFERVPMPWKPGDHVLVRQGFGPEIELREGRHHLVGRGNSDYGHGIIAAWNPKHAHCWHVRRKDGEAHCRCGSQVFLETRLPACSECPSGERLAAAELGGRVADVEIPSSPGAGEYEMRPIDDGRTDV